LRENATKNRNEKSMILLIYIEKVREMLQSAIKRRNIALSMDILTVDGRKRDDFFHREK